MWRLNMVDSICVDPWIMSDVGMLVREGIVEPFFCQGRQADLLSVRPTRTKRAGRSSH